MTRLATPVADGDHVLGVHDAPVTLVEYGSFGCPHCGAARGILRDVLRLMGASVRFVFRNFPLSLTHPRAAGAAEAVEAAGAQGRFWPMHNRLYGQPSSLEDEELLRAAAEVGCDIPRFARELVAGVYADRVREDVRSGLRSGVERTPSFFINGAHHEGPWDLDVLLAALQRAAVSARPVSQSTVSTRQAWALNTTWTGRPDLSPIWWRDRRDSDARTD